MTHGWPGSVLEYLDMIPPLTDPPAYGGTVEDAFDVVIPSLPGYGFSGKPTTSGWNVERIAGAWAQLMTRLGYDRYGAAGSDWGTSITSALAAQDAEHVAGIHLIPPLAGPDPDTPDLTDAERAANHRRLGVPRGGAEALPAMGVPPLPRHPILGRARPRRPLPRLGGARPPPRRPARLLPPGSVIRPIHHRAHYLSRSNTTP